MFLVLRKCKARSNSVSEGVKYLLTPTSNMIPVPKKMTQDSFPLPGSSFYYLIYHLFYNLLNRIYHDLLHFLPTNFF